MKSLLPVTLALITLCPSDAHSQLTSNPCLNSIGQAEGSVRPLAFEFYPTLSNSPGPPLTFYAQPTTLGTEVISSEFPGLPPEFAPHFWVDGTELRGSFTVFDLSDQFNSGPVGACLQLPRIGPGDFTFNVQLNRVRAGYRLSGTQRITGGFSIGPTQPIPSSSPLGLLALAIALGLIPFIRGVWRHPK